MLVNKKSSPKIKIIYRKIVLPDDDCWIKQYVVIPKEIRMNNELFEQIWDMHPFERYCDVYHGKIVTYQRFYKSYIKGNFKSNDPLLGNVNEHPFLAYLLDYVCRHSGLNYEHLHINWYEDGTDYIGYHRDKETFPGTNVYSFTYGEEREFYIRVDPDKQSLQPDYKLSISMPNNSMLIMGGFMQEIYQHSVPKRTSKRNPLNRRINITMRLLI